jgi:uncharacterized protein (UPF0303 family)
LYLVINITTTVSIADDTASANQRIADADRYARNAEEASAVSDAVEIGEIAKSLGVQRALPIAVEVRLGDWIVYHASLPGSSPENDWWIGRKARVVKLKQHSTMYERVLAEEQGIDWHKENNVLDETHAIHGGGLPLITKEDGCVGVLIISGLPQVDDHLLGVEVLTEFLARKGELL